MRRLFSWQFLALLLIATMACARDNSGQSFQPSSGPTVTAPKPPTDGELAGDSLSQFVTHHATDHYFNTGVTGSLARWIGEKRSVCPLTKGLNPEQDDYVTARIRALAEYVGAPVQPGPQCEYNVTILFTNNPHVEMDEVLPLWPQITQHYAASGTLGTHLGGGGGGGSIGAVILIVDTTKVVDYSIGAIADYLAMLSLSVAQSPDHCDPLPSILDLMSSSCDTREAPTAITAGDLAFLKALYYKNTGVSRSLTRSQIQDNMVREFKSH